MDDETRTGLWNVLFICYWDMMEDIYIHSNKNMQILLNQMWRIYFKKPLDSLNDRWEITYKQIRNYFFNDALWNEVYDFIEFISKYYPDDEMNEFFIKICNLTLEKEISAYRFVGGKITQITSEKEISEIEDALKIPLKPVNIHLENALELLSNKKNPNYRNSIKESISAVEAICNIITKEKSDTLGQALKKIEKMIPLHGALKKAFSNLYGYTSDAEGIRHALMEEPDLHFEDAKFMLVSCSAFINYLVSKASKAGIKLKK